MRLVKHLAVTCFAAVSVDVAVVNSVSAQELVDNGTGVTEEYRVRYRSRPEYDAQGIRRGSWLYLPSVTSELEFDSNVNKAEKGGKDSFVALLKPELSILSDFSRHSLNFNFSGRERFVFDDEDASTFTGHALVDGQVDVLRDLALTFGAGFDANQDELGDSTTPSSAKEGVRSNVYKANAGISKAFNRVNVYATGSVENYDYFSVETVNGGSLSQSFRDGTRYNVLSKVSYAYSPGLFAFVSAELNKRDWNGSGAANRDSDGYELLTGLEFDMRGTLHGSVSLGYLEQNYDLASFDDISSFSYGMDLEWTPTSLLTVNLNGRQLVEESSTAGSSGILTSNVGLSADYEFRRNWLVTPSVGYLREEFKGTDRVDDTIKAGLRTDYMVNRNLALQASYGYENRDSNEVGSSYDRHIGGVSFVVKY
ncbi:capsular polysaccharide biosynthesis protein [Pseudovibrio japonicus]|uniref:Capsular polysaccharide biosynthesis protein n=1 Tax=Pseudovibrio japonicus TaxID=366534 RepID=A0ABQ3ETV8_9HYPH|nr:outer membrane beta-barrel protein [Pseudovibrio japonicus]GHB49708.1 capsular polysaccharide biosynthesis protein [Pseudovibrio japonicus]